MRWLKKPKAMELLHMSQTKLQDRSKKVLAKLARKRGLAGWEQMSKDELLSALARRLHILDSEDEPGEHQDPLSTDSRHVSRLERG